MASAGIIAARSVVMLLGTNTHFKPSIFVIKLTFAF